MKNRSGITIFITILSVIGSFALLPEVKGTPEVAPPPDGCYPGLQQRKAAWPFKALPPALETQELAGVRSFQSAMAASTPVLARGRSFPRRTPFLLRRFVVPATLSEQHRNR